MWKKILEIIFLTQPNAFPEHKKNNTNGLMEELANTPVKFTKILLSHRGYRIIKWKISILLVLLQPSSDLNHKTMQLPLKPIVNINAEEKTYYKNEKTN